MQWLNELPFAGNRVVQIGFLAACGIAALIVLAIFYRLAFANRLRVPGGRTRQPRLGLVDAFSLDGQRQLVLVRRDNVEHLVMIGGPNDVLLELQINRAAVPARETSQASPLLMPSAPVRRTEVAPVPAPTAAEAPAKVAAKVLASPPAPAAASPAPPAVAPAPAAAGPSAPTVTSPPVPARGRAVWPDRAGCRQGDGACARAIEAAAIRAETDRARAGASRFPTAPASGRAGATRADEFPAASGAAASGDAAANCPSQRPGEPGRRRSPDREGALEERGRPAASAASCRACAAGASRETGAGRRGRKGGGGRSGA